MSGDFTGNTVLSNTTGAAICLAGTSQLEFDEFTGNDISSNSGPGLDLTAIDTAGFTLNIDNDEGANGDKEQYRPVFLNTQVQIVNELNNPPNQFEQFGIFRTSIQSS